MPLFHFTRENEDVIDKPHVSIKIGSGCPAGCDCDFSYKKLKKNILYSKKSILDNFLYADKNFSKDFEIFLVGLNLLKYEGLFDILDCITKNKRVFKLQISHNLDQPDIEMLEQIGKKYGSFNCSIPKTVDNGIDLGNLMKEILSLSKIKGLGKVYFDIFLDINKYDTIIKKIIAKFSTVRSLNEYNCVMGNLFDLKFHDLSWTIDKASKSIKNLKRKDCLLKEYFQLKDKKIYLNDHIEIGPNGNFTFHDNLCYLGNFGISNNSLEQEQIYNDFIKYKKYLGKISKGNLVKKCYICIKNSYNYKKELDSYSY